MEIDMHELESDIRKVYGAIGCEFTNSKNGRQALRDSMEAMGRIEAVLTALSVSVSGKYDPSCVATA